MTATQTRSLEILAGVLVGLAGAVHGLVSRAHFEEWWAYGVFFLAATVAQALLGLALAANALDPSHAGVAFDRRWRPRMYLAGIVGNTLMVALYLYTRIIGVPFGPDVGGVEAWDGLGIASVVAEVGAVIILFALVKRRA